MQVMRQIVGGVRGWADWEGGRYSQVAMSDI